MKIDYNVIRGLAYYTGVIYEAFDRHGKFRAIAGGGRYDQLIKLVSKGKSDLPAAGFAMGDVVLVELLKERGLLPELRLSLDAYVMVEDEAMRASSLKFIQEIRDFGLHVEYPVVALKPDKQFKRALELGARFAVRLTDASTAVLKNLESREETTLPVAEVAEKLI